MQSEELLRFALYARVSTEGQEAHGESLDTQLKQMRSWVQSLGGVVVKEYRAQESAMPGADRPSLRMLFGDAKRGVFNAVMVVALDRFSRDPVQSGAIENNLRLFSLRFFEKERENDLLTPEGKLMRRMHAVIGAFTVDRTQWSAAASRLEIARRGWPHGAKRPFGRVPANPGERRTASAKWVLHDEEYALVRKMCSLYLNEGKTFAEVGKAVDMHPETVRRILVYQSGSVWEREFKDPATSQMVRVSTDIPPLLSTQEIAQVLVRAKVNQDARQAWAGRKRDYPLSKYLRCANPLCNWSNLSGHQTYDRQRDKETGEEREVAYAYYVHLSRYKQKHDCLASVPAQEIEDAVFGRIGQLLKHEDVLIEAVKAAIGKDQPNLQNLKDQRGTLESRLAGDKRRLRNAVELLTEHKGTNAESVLQEKVRALSASIDVAEKELFALEGRLGAISQPHDAVERARMLIARLRGLNGYAPVFWPIEAKRVLLAIFFGGPQSTRFDRSGTHVRSDARGIFVKKVVSPEMGVYWTYLARGQIGSVGGALTEVISIADRFDREEIGTGFSLEILVELARAVDWSGAPELFRVDPHAGRPMFASRCP